MTAVLESVSTATAACAVVRDAFAEPVHGTAPAGARSWLLVEHPGPWPAAGLPEDLPAAARSVIEQAQERGVRPQLIRPVRDRRGRRPLIAVASVRPGAVWLEQREVSDLAALAELDVDALASGRPPGFGHPTDPTDPRAGGVPLVLVCTHGRRDVCCARLGRPVARLLAQALPAGTVWETSHVGGDRFAANVVTLPDGMFHGGLTAEDVPALVRAVQDGAVLLDQLRGRAGLPPAVQAADYYLRRMLTGTGTGHGSGAGTAAALLGAADVLPVRWDAEGDDTTAVLATTRHGRWRVTVRREVDQQPRRTSCAIGAALGRPSKHDLLAIEPSA